MKSVSFVYILTLLFSLSAFARMEILDPLKVETEIPVWNQQYGAKVDEMKKANTYPAEGYTECREVIEIASAFLCLSNTQKGMNSSLGRASFFVEGLGDPSVKGKVLKQDNGTYLQYKNLIGGHDLKGSDLLRFHEKVTEECAASKNDPNICYNLYEKDIFENFIVPHANKLSHFVVITFAHSSSMNWRDVVTHEIMHAQYFNQNKFREVVDDFWEKDVPESDKKLIRSRLGQNYDSSDEFLMKNEFQAYILMAGADFSELAAFVDKYREPLTKRLLDNGVVPVQIK